MLNKLISGFKGGWLFEDIQGLGLSKSEPQKQGFTK